MVAVITVIPGLKVPIAGLRLSTFWDGIKVTSKGAPLLSIANTAWGTKLTKSDVEPGRFESSLNCDAGHLIVGAVVDKQNITCFNSYDNL